MTPLPEGFGLELDRSVRRFRDGTVLVGGHPGRLITLSADGVAALDGLLRGAPASAGARQLAGRLVEAGMAHPLVGGSSAHPLVGGKAAHLSPADVTVVVPAHDRIDDLEACLASLSPESPPLVVDDGSADPSAVAELCSAHGARLLRRHVNGGPAAARNDGLEAVDTELVAFVDSDCTVTRGWLDPLVALFADPSIGAVAPRILPRAASPRPAPAGRAPVLARYSEARSPLDMGAVPSEVGPQRLVRYLPSAALVVRRSALAPPPDGAGPFDPGLRVGEDVDLVWRLVAAGWRVRYEPSVTVGHREPDRWSDLVARRYRYGTSAGALARRHPGRLAPVDLRPWPTAVALAVAAGRPRSAAVALAAAARALDRELGDHGIPFSQILRWTAGGVGWTLHGTARAATMLGGPLVLLAVARGPRRARVLGTLALTVPPVVEWWRQRPPLDPARWLAASIVDDTAYGLGVWTGCIATRSWSPLIPSFHRSWSPASDVPGAPPTAV